MFEAHAQTADAPTDPAAVDGLAASAPETVEQAVRVDPAFILSKVETWVVGFQRLLPNIVVAVVLFIIVFVIAWAVERAFRRWAEKRDRSNPGAVLLPDNNGLGLFSGDGIRLQQAFRTLPLSRNGYAESACGIRSRRSNEPKSPLPLSTTSGDFERGLQRSRPGTRMSAGSRRK